MVATRRSINQIHYLLDNGGQRITDIEEVKSHFVAYFSDLFGGNSQVMTKADHDQVALLTKYEYSEPTKISLQAPVTAEDARREVFALPANKTPGPDRYTG